MAEFFNDEQRAAQIAALEREAEGYEHRKARGKHGRDPLSVAELDDRIDQVNDELARIKGEVSVEETVKEEKKPKSSPKGRGAKKPAPAKDDGAGSKNDGGSSDGGKES